MRDRDVLVTGGTGFLGVKVTQIALARGARVTVPVFRTVEVERLRVALGDRADAVRLVEADLRDEDHVQRLIDDMPGLDVVLHTVGGFTMGPTVELSHADWREHLDLNLTPCFLVCKHALRRMLPADYGRIVTVASRAAIEPAGQMAAYSAAKAGVLALTRAIAAETKGTGITANTVLPSVIDTPANRAAMGDEEADRWVTPAQLADVIAFLGSEAAAKIRGAAIEVYGDV